MRENRIIAICLATAALISAAWLVARADNVIPAPRAGDETTAPPSAEPNTNEAAQLVTKIRHQIGSPLDGSVFGSAPVEEPAAPIVAGEHGAAAETVEFGEVYAEIARASEWSGDPRQLGGPPQACEFAIEGYSLDPHEQVRQSLRDAARQLEATAADLEDGSAFAEADALRRWARRLRANARR